MPVVTLDTEHDVDRSAGLQLLEAMGGAPGNRVQIASAARQAQLHPVLCHGSRRATESRVPHQQRRRGIADTERLEVAKDRLQLRSDIVDRELEIDMDLGHEILLAQLGRARPR